MSEYTEAQKKAVRRYLSQMHEFKVRVPKASATRADIEDAAAAVHESVNQFFTTAALERIEHIRSKGLLPPKEGE